MPQEHDTPAAAQQNYLVGPGDLPLSCPTDKMILWNAHPKVYLPLEETGEVVCPYCGARYILQND